MTEFVKFIFVQPHSSDFLFDKTHRKVKSNFLTRGSFCNNILALTFIGTQTRTRSRSAEARLRRNMLVMLLILGNIHHSRDDQGVADDPQNSDEPVEENGGDDLVQRQVVQGFVYVIFVCVVIVTIIIIVVIFVSRMIVMSHFCRRQIILRTIIMFFENSSINLSD